MLRQGPDVRDPAGPVRQGPEGVHAYVRFDDGDLSQDQYPEVRLHRDVAHVDARHSWAQQQHLRRSEVFLQDEQSHDRQAPLVKTPPTFGTSSLRIGKSRLSFSSESLYD